jgi:hypothetical protein
MNDQKNRAAAERFKRQALRAEQAWRDGGSRWECEDCGWPQPPMVPLAEGAECDNCGGEMVPAGGQS